jgi:hypothetical protein
MGQDDDDDNATTTPCCSRQYQKLHGIGRLNGLAKGVDLYHIPQFLNTLRWHQRVKAFQNGFGLSGNQTKRAESRRFMSRRAIGMFQACFVSV